MLDEKFQIEEFTWNRTQSSFWAPVSRRTYSTLERARQDWESLKEEHPNLQFRIVKITREVVEE